MTFLAFLVWFIILYPLAGVLLLSLIRLIVRQPILNYYDSPLPVVAFWPISILILLIEGLLALETKVKIFKRWKDWMREPNPEYYPNDEDDDDDDEEGGVSRR